MPFRGEMVTDTISQVLEREPDWSKLPESVPRRLRELEAILEDPGIESVVIDSDAAPSKAGIPIWLSVLAGLVAGALAVWVGVMMTADQVDAPPPDGSLSVRVAENDKFEKRFEIEVGLTARVGFDPVLARPVISPDGRRIAYVANLDGVGRVYVRDLDDLTVRVVPKSEDAKYPFFSADSESIGYLRETEEGNALFVAPVETLKSREICNVRGGWGFAWLKDGTILFASPAEELSQGVLYKVSLVDRDPVAVTSVSGDAVPGDELFHMYPTAVPGENLALFQMTYADENEDHFDNPRSLALFDVDAGTHEVVVKNALWGYYVETGHIVFVRANELWAVPFDLESRTVSGEEFLLQIQGSFDMLWHNRPFSLSAAGAIVFQPELEVFETERVMVWVDQNGVEETVAAPGGEFTVPRMSPDGSRIGVTMTVDDNLDIWMHDVASPGSMTRVTFHQEIDRGVAWYPDSQNLAFSSFRDGTVDIFQRGADGLGDVTKLLDTGRPISPIVMSADGKNLTYMELNVGWDLGVMNLTDGSF